MNREQLDTIVKQALFAYATSLLIEIGRECTYGDANTSKWCVGRIHERETALKFISDDAARGKIVDAILKEMKP